jgi:hypothetical protein
MIDVRFENLDAVKRAYDPIVVEKAAFSAVRHLHNKAATQVSRSVRGTYNIKASRLKMALKKRIRMQQGTPAGFLIYTGQRLSLRNFAVGGAAPRKSNQPVRKTARGKRRGVRVRIMKTRGSHVVPRAFWGRGRAGSTDGAGEQQIFQRIGLSRLPVRKLTGPSVAHMVRGQAGVDEINKMMARDADRVLSQALDQFLARQIGIR